MLSGNPNGNKKEVLYKTGGNSSERVRLKPILPDGSE